MKKVVTTILVYDDVDLAEGTKTPADITISLGYHGNWYELDLTREHSDELHALLQPYIQAGRKPDFPLRETSRRKKSGGGTGLILRSWEHGRTYGAAIRKFILETEDREMGAYIGREPRDKFAKYLAGLPEKERPLFYKPQPGE